MPYTKNIVCLAASYKPGGTCVAGKELNPDGSIGPWVRPIGRKTAALSEKECTLSTGGIPKLLDVVRVSLEEPTPDGHQTENHRIAPNAPWKKHGSLETARINALVDSPVSLWRNVGSSTYGANDSVDAGPALERIKSSLKLIAPQQLRIQVGREYGRVKVRVWFKYKGVIYVLKLTDPLAAALYLRKGVGSYDLDPDAFVLCISLSEVLARMNKCYKLVAGLIARG